MFEQDKLKINKLFGGNDFAWALVLKLRLSPIFVWWGNSYNVFENFRQFIGSPWFLACWNISSIWNQLGTNSYTLTQSLGPFGSEQTVSSAESQKGIDSILWNTVVSVLFLWGPYEGEFGNCHTFRQFRKSVFKWNDGQEELATIIREYVSTAELPSITH